MWYFKLNHCLESRKCIFYNLFIFVSLIYVRSSHQVIMICGFMIRTSTPILRRTRIKFTFVTHWGLVVSYSVRGPDVFFDLRQNYDWVNNREAGDLRRHHTHCDVIVIHSKLQRTAQQRHPPCSSYIKDVFDDYALCRWHKFHYSGVILTSTSSRGLSITSRASTPPGHERSWHTRLLSTEIKMVYYTYMYKCRPDSMIPLWS